MQRLSLLLGSETATEAPEFAPSGMFALPAPRGSSRWRAFAVSLVLHVAGALLMPQVSAPLLTEKKFDPWTRHTVLLKTLRLKVPEPLYLASAGTKSRPAPSARTQTRRPAAKQASAGMARAGVENRKRRLDLPPLPRRDDTDQSVLQPRYAADLLPERDLHLPEVFFWAPEVGRSREVKPFVIPGHAETPTAPRILDLPPGLEVPRPVESFYANVKPALQPASAFLPESAMPVQTSFPEAPEPRAGSSADPLSGDPTTVLSVTAAGMPLREFLTVPPGNQVGRTPGEPRGRASGSGGHADSGDGANGAGASREPDGASSSTPGTAGSAAPSSELAAPSPPSYPPALAARIAAAEATRVAHPSNGVFDVVIQSADLEGFPESAGVLSGRPVYSVFLRVGAAKDWILQYCVPAGEDEQAAQLVEGVIRLGTPARTQAPYPRVSMRPLVYGRRGAYLMVHGFIDAAGRFQDLKVLGAHDPQETGVVLAVLERWEFRPAVRSGTPVRVEALLAMPLE